MAQNRGWIGGAWQKDPLRLGYSGDKTEVLSNLSATAGTNYLESATVPAGEIWKLQAAHAYNANNTTGKTNLYVVANGGTVYLKSDIAPAANVLTIWTGEIVLSEGDKLGAEFTACTLNDDIHMSYHAVRVDIDQ